MSVVFGTWIQPLTNYLTIYARPFIFFSANEYSFKFFLPGRDGNWINIFSVLPRKACQIHKFSIGNFNPRPNSMFLTIDQNLCKKNYSICYIFFVSAKFCFILVYFHIFYWQNVVRRYRRSRINLLWHTITCYGVYPTNKNPWRTHDFLVFLMQVAREYVVKIPVLSRWMSTIWSRVWGRVFARQEPVI